MEKKEKYTLKQLRSLNDLSQEDLAEKSGVSSRTIHAFESDISKLRNGKYETLEKIAKSLGARVCDIFLDPVSEIPKSLQNIA